ncbi:hypothetical protein Tco_1333443, partial [Tanacetum coccineum]
GMPIEFVAWVDGNTFRVSQFLLEIYNEEAFIDNHHIYIISSEGYRYRAKLVTPDEGMWHVNEVGGYGVNRSTFFRFMTRVLPYPHIPQALPAEFVSNLNEDDEIEIYVNGMMLSCNVFRQEMIDHPGRHEFVLLGDTWDTLVKSLDLENGSTNVVFKGAATLRRQQLQLTLLEEFDDRMKHVCFWPFHMEHFGEMPKTFYKRFDLIARENRLAVPGYFAGFHHMRTFKKASIIHQQYEEFMEVRMVLHLEDPSRTNHVHPWTVKTSN